MNKIVDPSGRAV